MSQNDPTSPKPSDPSVAAIANSAEVPPAHSGGSNGDAASAASDTTASPSPSVNNTPDNAGSSAAAAAASADATAGPGSEGDDGGDEGDDAEGGADAAEGGATAEGGAPGVAGAPAKRKRRRRRKKKTGEGATAEGATAEGAVPEGGVEGDLHPIGPPRPPRLQHEKHGKKERPERERPAFNVGDVVFGKVIEVTEDALFADLSGKAKAIFDLRELLITEEEAEEYNRAHKADRKAAQADPEEAAHVAAEAAAAAAAAAAGEGEAAASSPVAVEGAPAAAPSEAELGAPPTEVSPGQAPSSTTQSEQAASDGSTTEASSEAAAAAPAAAESSPDGASAEDAKSPQLPRVILEPGAPFVGLVHNDGGRGGLVVLTHHPKRVSKAKPMVAEASRSGALVFGLVTGTIKGGVEVDVDGLRAFAPASHVDLRPGSDLSHLVGKRLAFAVTQYAKRGRDVVLSRRSLLEAEYKEKREEALKNIKFGEVVDGIVRTIVPFGAFVDVGGVEGLVPLSEMSHNRADGPKDVFKLIETTRVTIRRVDEKGKLWL
ncbi:MAG: ribosomal protein S1p, partial [Labilithrix sp.]|nr:ribosomal protein S1p [Labilithrix sp.]